MTILLSFYFYINFYLFNNSYISCPELDDQDDSDSTSITTKKNESPLNIYAKSLSSKHKRFSFSKFQNKIIEKNIEEKDESSEDEFKGLVADIPLQKRRTNAPRLSLKFHEDMKELNDLHYSLDCTNYVSSYNTRKWSEDMKLEPNLFSKQKGKKQNNTSSKIYKTSQLSITSPDFEKKKNLFKMSHLSNKFSINEEEEFSLQPTKFISSNLHDTIFSEYNKLNNSAGVRKGSSILAKLVSGVSRRNTIQLQKINDIEEEDFKL